MPFKPRPKQAEVLKYQRGWMGVAAVPGAGKTKTLSALAAKLIYENRLRDDQEVLIVTLVNSAVDNFSRQVRELLAETKLLPNFGYRVRTLHSLCSEIVRERPGLVGLADDFQIVDEREAAGILYDAVNAWVRANPDSLDEFLAPDFDQSKVDYVRRESWGEAVSSIAGAFIRQAKDEQLLPDHIRQGLDKRGKRLALAEMCYEIYANYQRSLHYRGAVDFQDLIRLALQALTLDEGYLKRLRNRFPYILEDEAQDSSLLQEDILRLLAGKEGNWVRVGDPNQAIYETFTTARPENLIRFIESQEVTRRELPDSGRCAPKIIKLANALIDWTRERHPNPAIRQRESLHLPYIRPTGKNDPQPNPPDDAAKITFYAKALTPAEEVEIVIESIKRWLPDHPNETVAVLAPRNKRGFEIVDALKNAKLDYVELLRSTTSTREAAGAIGNILSYLAKPGDANRLATVYKVWRREERDDPEASAKLERIAKAIRKCAHVEDLIWNSLGRDWLDDSEEAAELAKEDPYARGQLEVFRTLIRKWQEAVLLPIDQLILILAGDLFAGAADLAIAHSLAVLLNQRADVHPDWRLPQYVDELAAIARNERRFLSVTEDDRGFDPELHKGKVTVATMHSAKGLEWDRVHLLSLNTYDFPAALPGDQFISERWFVREGINLEAEALAQLKAIKNGEEYFEGAASESARLDYAAERLRLLYVGITRARKELIATWNTGRRGDQQPSAPFEALRSIVEAENL